MMEEYLTAEEIAHLLRVSYDTIARLLREKKMPGYKIYGSWRVRRTDFEAWLEDQRNIQDTK
jgi:excisionase family DNA binding protein